MTTLRRDLRTLNGRPITGLAPSIATLSDRPQDWVFRYDPTEQFPEMPIGLGLTVQILWVTPEMALDWLTRNGTSQRKIKKNHLASLVEDLNAGRWRLNGEPIILDDQDQLINGQHRLNASIETGVPILTLVVRGLPAEVYTTMDITSKRTSADTLKTSGFKNTSALGAAALLLRRYQRGLIGKTQIVLSPIAIEETVREFPGLEDSAGATTTCSKVVRSAAAAVFCHYILNGIDEPAATEFFDKIASGADLGKHNPILTLRNKLRDDRPTADEVTFFIFKAWNAWRKNKTLANLRRGDDEPLPTPI